MTKSERIKRIQKIRLKASDDLADSNISFILNDPTLCKNKKWQELAHLIEESNKAIHRLFEAASEQDRSRNKT